MALRSVDGRLLALLCGFVQGTRFHLLSQWNDPAFEKLSLSTVLRGYAVEHLIAQGFRQWLFVGGTTLTFARFCKPQLYQLLMIERERGFLALAKRLLAKLAARRAARNKSLPFRAERLAGAFLERKLIAERTPLLQAGALDTDGEGASA